MWQCEAIVMAGAGILIGFVAADAWCRIRHRADRRVDRDQTTFIPRLIKKKGEKWR
jgi:hypothetical protein